MATTPEGKFKKAFLTKLKRAVKPTAILQYEQSSTTVKGFPDTIVVLEGITIFIEFKASSRSKFQPLQKEWNQKLTDNGHFAFICYPQNENEVLEEIKRIA